MVKAAVLMDPLQNEVRIYFCDTIEFGEEGRGR